LLDKEKMQDQKSGHPAGAQKGETTPAEGR